MTSSTSSSHIYEVLSHAQSKGVMYPKIRIGKFQFSPSKYPATVYVKHRESREYMGKIVGSVFFPVSRWIPTPAEIEQINQIISQPLAESIQAHGIQTGTCCFCGRTLLAGVSVAAQIGPVCAEKYGISQHERATSITAENLGF